MQNVPRDQKEIQESMSKAREKVLAREAEERAAREFSGESTPSRDRTTRSVRVLDPAEPYREAYCRGVPRVLSYISGDVCEHQEDVKAEARLSAR